MRPARCCCCPPSRTGALHGRVLLALPALPVLPVLLVLLLAPAPARAVPPALCTRWEVFEPSNGFPSLIIHDLVLDGEELWAATGEGIARRVAGKRWEIWTHGHGLPHSVVWALALAENGDVWAGTPAGLVRLSGGRIDVFRAADSGLPADVVYDVAVAGPLVWVATAGGLACYDTHGGDWSVWTLENSPLPVAACSRVLAGPQQVWAASFGGGLWALDPQGDGWRSLTDDAAAAAGAPRTPAAGLGLGLGPSRDAPWTISPGTDGDSLWIAYEGGLDRLQGGSFSRLLPVAASLAATEPLPPSSPPSPLSPSPSLPSPSPASPSPPSPTPARPPVPSPHVQALAEAGGLLFVGTDRGLAVLHDGHWLVHGTTPDGSRGTVTLPPAQSGEAPRTLVLESTIAGSPVLSLALGQDDVWLGTARGLGHCAEASPVQPWPTPAAAAPPAPAPAPSQPSPPAPPRQAAPGDRPLPQPEAAAADPAGLPGPRPADPGVLPYSVAQIRLGLVLPARPEESPARAVEQGVRLAMEEQGPTAGWGPRRYPIVLEVRTLPVLPWEGLASTSAFGLVSPGGARLLLVPPSADGVPELEQLLLARRAEVPLVVLGGDDPLLAEVGRSWVVPVGWDGQAGLAGLIEQLVGRGFVRPVLVREPGRSGRAGAASCVRQLAARGLALAGEVEHSRGQSIVATASAVARLRPDALLLWTSPRRAAELLAVLHAAGLRLPCFAPSRLDTPAFLSAAGGLAEGCTVALAARPSPGPAWDAFAGTFRQRFGATPDRWAALGYATARWLLEVLPGLPTIDRAAVARALQDALPRWSPELVLPRGDGRDGVPLGVVQGGEVVPLAGQDLVLRPEP